MYVHDFRCKHVVVFGNFGTELGGKKHLPDVGVAELRREGRYQKSPKCAGMFTILRSLCHTSWRTRLWEGKNTGSRHKCCTELAGGAWSDSWGWHARSTHRDCLATDGWLHANTSPQSNIGPCSFRYWRGFIVWTSWATRLQGYSAKSLTKKRQRRPKPGHSWIQTQLFRRAS